MDELLLLQPGWATMAVQRQRSDGVGLALDCTLDQQHRLEGDIIKKLL